MTPETTTLIRSALLLSESHEAGDLADLLIQDGRIVDVLPAGASAAGPFHEINAQGCLVMPGLINGHTHAHGALGRGAVDDSVSLEGFLAQSAAINGGRSLQDVALSAQLSAVEQLRHGCTSTFDMAMQMPAPSVQGLLAVAQAYQQVGMRAVVAPMIADKTLFQAYPELFKSLPADLQQRVAQSVLPDAASQLAVCRQAQIDWPFDRSQLQLGIGPTIPLHCSDGLLIACAQLSQEFGVPLQTHLAESRLQAIYGIKHQGESPVRRLARLGCLTPRTSVAHSVWIDDADMALLALHGVTVVHNPLSNLRLGSGIAPMRQLLQAGVRVGIGTDAANTSDGQNMFEALRMASLLSRVASPDWSTWVTAQQALAMAMSGAAGALGLGVKLGRIAPGYAADLLFIDLQQTHFVPLRHVLRQLVLAESGAGIRRVMVNGKTAFEGGKVLGIDEAELNRAAQAAADRLDAAQQGVREGTRALLPWIRSFSTQAGNAAFALND